jgi:thiosulfate/3-mercaptopyruvate sulfurtransferase
MISKKAARERHMRSLKIILLVLILAAGPGLAAQSQNQTPRLVSTEWLAANLNNENIRIVDSRLDIRDYWLSHIPGAVYLDTAVLRWPERGVPSKLLSPEALVILLGQMGITEKTMVVAYYDKNGYPPFYLLWALDYIGHPVSALLEDGFERWRREGRPLNQDYPKIKPAAYPKPAKLNTQFRATIEEVVRDMKAGAVLVDTRSEDLYTGEKGAWKRKGHIRGALSHPWVMDLGGDGSWKPREELAAEYARIGVTPDKEVIVYCGQGQQAAHTYFSLKHILGFPDVRLYDGGFNEWANRDELPVQTGKNP